VKAWTNPKIWKGFRSKRLRRRGNALPQGRGFTLTTRTVVRKLLRGRWRDRREKNQRKWTRLSSSRTKEARDQRRSAEGNEMDDFLLIFLFIYQVFICLVFFPFPSNIPSLHCFFFFTPLFFYLLFTFNIIKYTLIFESLHEHSSSEYNSAIKT